MDNATRLLRSGDLSLEDVAIGQEKMVLELLEKLLSEVMHFRGFLKSARFSDEETFYATTMGLLRAAMLSIQATGASVYRRIGGGDTLDRIVTISAETEETLRRAISGESVVLPVSCSSVVGFLALPETERSQYSMLHRGVPIHTNETLDWWIIPNVGMLGESLRVRSEQLRRQGVGVQGMFVLLWKGLGPKDDMIFQFIQPGQAFPPYTTAFLIRAMQALAPAFIDAFRQRDQLANAPDRAQFAVAVFDELEEGISGALARARGKLESS